MFELLKTKWKQYWNRIQVVSASKEKAKEEKLECDVRGLKTGSLKTTVFNQVWIQFLNKFVCTL